MRKKADMEGFRSRGEQASFMERKYYDTSVQCSVNMVDFMNCVLYLQHHGISAVKMAQVGRAAIEALAWCAANEQLEVYESPFEAEQAFLDMGFVSSPGGRGKYSHMRAMQQFQLKTGSITETRVKHPERDEKWVLEQAEIAKNLWNERLARDEHTKSQTQGFISVVHEPAPSPIGSIIRADGEINFNNLDALKAELTVPPADTVRIETLPPKISTENNSEEDSANAK